MTMKMRRRRGGRRLGGKSGVGGGGGGRRVGGESGVMIIGRGMDSFILVSLGDFLGGGGGGRRLDDEPEVMIIEELSPELPRDVPVVSVLKLIPGVSLFSDVVETGIELRSAVVLVVAFGALYISLVTGEILPLLTGIETMSGV